MLDRDILNDFQYTVGRDILSGGSRIEFSIETNIVSECQNV